MSFVQLNHDGPAVRVEGRDVRLRPKSFAVFRYLLENEGRVVNKDELLEAAWPATAVTGDSLVQCIIEIRRALGVEHAKRLVTVPRVGYVLRGRLPEAGQESERAPRRPPVALLLVLAGLTLAGLTTTLTPELDGPVRAVAVLPLHSLDEGENGTSLGLGIADAIVTRLTRLPNTLVRSPSARGPVAEPLEVGRALGVDVVMTGTLQRTDRAVRVHVQLFQVEDGRFIWARTFDAGLDDLFKMQDLVARRVEEALAPGIEADLAERPVARHPENIEAYRLYWKGRYFWDKRTPDGLEKAITYFERAARVDPDYALAYAGMAHAYGVLAIQGFMAPAEARGPMRDAVRKALELDDSLAEAHLSLAAFRLGLEWDWSGAEKAYRRAIELDPDYPTAHLWYGWFLQSMKRHQDSLPYRRRAIELDPLNLQINTALADNYFDMGRTDEAIAQIRETLELDPRFVPAHRSLARFQLRLGKYEGAIVSLRHGSNLGLLGYAYARAGRTAEARSLLRELEARSRESYVSPLQRASIYAGLGDRDAAFHWLDVAYEDRTSWLCRLLVEPTLGPLRDDPRFAALARRLGLPL